VLGRQPLLSVKVGGLKSILAVLADSWHVVLAALTHCSVYMLRAAGQANMTFPTLPTCNEEDEGEHGLHARHFELLLLRTAIPSVFDGSAKSASCENIPQT